MRRRYKLHKGEGKSLKDLSWPSQREGMFLRNMQIIDRWKYPVLFSIQFLSLGLVALS